MHRSLPGNRVHEETAGGELAVSRPVYPYPSGVRAARPDFERHHAGLVVQFELGGFERRAVAGTQVARVEIQHQHAIAAFDPRGHMRLGTGFNTRSGPDACSVTRTSYRPGEPASTGSAMRSSLH